MRFEIIGAEEQKTSTHTRQLIIVKSVEENLMGSFWDGFRRGLWLVVKWTLITIFVIVGLSALIGGLS